MDLVIPLSSPRPIPSFCSVETLCFYLLSQPITQSISLLFHILLFCTSDKSRSHACQLLSLLLNSKRRRVYIICQGERCFCPLLASSFSEDPQGRSHVPSSSQSSAQPEEEKTGSDRQTYLPYAAQAALARRPAWIYVKSLTRFYRIFASGVFSSPATFVLWPSVFSNRNGSRPRLDIAQPRIEMASTVEVDSHAYPSCGPGQSFHWVLNRFQLPSYPPSRAPVPPSLNRLPSISFLLLSLSLPLSFLLFLSSSQLCSLQSLRFSSSSWDLRFGFYVRLFCTWYTFQLFRTHVIYSAIYLMGSSSLAFELIFSSNYPERKSKLQASRCSHGLLTSLAGWIESPLPTVKV
jgi:hypothetical protein